MRRIIRPAFLTEGANEMHLREVRIDKTDVIEEALKDHLAVVLSGLPGTGRKTAVVTLVDKHPEVNALYCDAEEIENASALSRRTPGGPNWYLVRKPEENRYPDSPDGFRRFTQKMPREDRIICAVDGRIPDVFLEFVWSGIMAVILPESLRFTEAETYRYLRICGSRLRGGEVYHLTGGWPGCAAMLVRLSSQLDDRWTVWELCSRYEIRQYIRTRILSALPEDELEMLMERAPFPRLEEELELLLWGDSRRDEEDRLCARGAMVFVPEKTCWYVHPALQIAIDDPAPEELCRRAVDWYEAKGYIQDALVCSRRSDGRQSGSRRSGSRQSDSRQSGGRLLYRECLLRNFDKVSFLNYEKIWGGDDLTVPGFLYLEWMESFLRQDRGRLRVLRTYAAKLKERAETERRQEITEVLLNMAYADPDIAAKEWMAMLERYTGDGQRIRLYHILGESVSFLSGLRDLSPLFACGEEQGEHYRRLWEERIALEDQMLFRLARLEYSIMTDTMPAWNKLRSEAFLPYEEGASWQIRLGSMYLAWLLLDDSEMRGPARRYIEELARNLAGEDAPACRWNARALYYLARAKCNEKEKLMEWLRDTGGDIGYDTGRTRFHMAAEVKVSLYVGDYRRAEELLPELIDYFRNGNSRRWLAESLFQRALAEQEKGMSGQALKTAAESIQTAEPYRYVRLYTGYGPAGAKLLEQYAALNCPPETASGRRYGGKEDAVSISGMSREQWIRYLARAASERSADSPVPADESAGIRRAERLTPTEALVLTYLEKGYSNSRISEEMNIRLSTVKSHTYNIYRKLEVSNRTQAVQRARDLGLL